MLFRSIPSLFIHSMSSISTEETRLCECVELICNDVCEREGLVVSKEAISMIEDNVLRYLKRFASDLEAFAIHGQRNEVSVVDVVYCSTKSVELNEAILHFVESHS
mgnify:CR=1 FL=1